MMKKKLLSVALSTVLTVTTAVGLVGCGSSSSAATGSTAAAADYSQFITVDVYDETANYQGIQSGWFAQIVKEKFNMELNIIAPNVSGGGDTLYQTRSAAGNLGDLIILNNSNRKLNDLVDSGLVKDCSSYFTGKDIMTNYSGAASAVASSVGQSGVYGFPNNVSTKSASESSEGLEPTFGTYLLWQYYKELGYPSMSNSEDLLNVLEKMQTLARQETGNDKIYAISLFKDWDANMMNNAKQLCCMYGFDELGFTLAKADGTSYESIIDSNSEYAKSLKFLYEANQRGLVDPDSTSQNYDTLSNKYKNGTVLYCPWPWLCQAQYNTTENKAAGKGYMYAPVSDMQIFSYGCCPEGNANGIITIGSSAKDPQRLADFINWLYSPEGVEISEQANGAAGPEGLTWTKNADGQAELTDFGNSALPTNTVTVPEEYGGGTWKDGMSCLNFTAVNINDTDPNTGEAYNYATWKTTLAATETALDADWRNQMGSSTTMDYLRQHNMLIVAPGSSYSAPQADSNITTVRSQCKATIVDKSWQLIFASDEAKFNSLFQDMQKTAEGLGYNDVLKVDMQNAQDQNTARVESAAKYK